MAMEFPLLIVIAVAAVALVLGWFVGRGAKPGPEPDRYAPALERLATEFADGRVAAASPGDPTSVDAVRRAVADHWEPQNEKREEAMRQAFGRVAAFLDNVVREPLTKVRDGDRELMAEGIDRALGGLADLEFYLRDPLRPDETHNLTALLQQVTREFIGDWEIGIRFSAPPMPVQAHIHRASFLDAVYLLLHNAGHFGGGKTIDVRVESGNGEARVVIRDRGPGFDDEAMRRARDLFYTTRPGALGLGIPFARKVIEGFGGRLVLANHAEGGAEVTLVLPQA